MTEFKPITEVKDVEVEPLTAAAAELWRTLRDPGCVLCPMHDWARTVCMFGNGPVPAAGMIVGEGPGDVEDQRKRPFQGQSGQFLDVVLSDTEVERARVYITNATKCAAPRDRDLKDQLLEEAKKACALFLERELEAVKPRAVLAIGAIAYYFFSHKKGISKARGQAFYSERWGCWVVPTVHPQYVLANPAFHAMFVSDVRKFKRLMHGEPVSPPVDIVMADTVDKVAEAFKELNEVQAQRYTFDFETRGFYDHDPEGFQAWCFAVTAGQEYEHGQGPRVYIIPLEHPDSPFLAHPPPLDWPTPEQWPPDPPLRVAEKHVDAVVGESVRFLTTHRLAGHNVKYDMRQLQRLAERYSYASH